ncbi:MAG: leucyl/phenylalanyl-tRNA--protein transferase [bacterium]|nr:leucyl/phenylalanyl-tRNA--protein transferase [bacterium]
MSVFQLNQYPVFPPADLAEPEGLLAVGGDLSPLRLLEAYRQGIFPWYEPGEAILWWSPQPRLVLFPQKMHVSRRLQRTIASGRFTLSADSAFAQVIAACAAIPRRDGRGTWLGADMQAAYILLHELGFAHSVECRQDGVLVGGLYGLCLDRVFFGESMFSAVTDASKIALAGLVQAAPRLNIELIDCQVSSGHLLRLGAEEIERDHFLRLLRRLIHRPEPQEKWRLPYTGKEGNGTADAKRGIGSHEQDVKPTDT